MANAAPESYETIFKTELLASDVRPFDHKVDLQFIVNDCLMAIHFGLALQEICVAMLPGGAMNPISQVIYQHTSLTTRCGKGGFTGVF